MTKKRYRGKIMQVQRNIDKYGREYGFDRCVNTDRFKRPDFGIKITYGKYAGQILRSYEQAWDMICEGLKGTPFLDGVAL